MRTALPTLFRQSFKLKMVVGCRQIVVLASQRGSQLWGGGGAEKKKTDASRRGGGLRPWHSGTAGWRCLGCLSGSRGKNADTFGKGNEFSHGSDLHFLHHPVAMSLDRALGPAYRAGDLLVGVAANDKLEDLPLARR